MWCENWMSIEEDHHSFVHWSPVTQNVAFPGSTFHLFFCVRVRSAKNYNESQLQLFNYGWYSLNKSKFYWCLQGQLCDHRLWFWLGGNLTGICRITCEPCYVILKKMMSYRNCVCRQYYSMNNRLIYFFSSANWWDILEKR